MKSVKKKLVLKLKKGDFNIVDLSIFVPKLIDNNFLIIKGRRKIPIFQLFDIPLITRDGTMKIRTNPALLIINSLKKRDPVYTYITFLKRKLPLALVVFSYYGMEKTTEMFNLDSFQLDDEYEKTQYNKFLHDLKDYQVNSEGYTQEDFILELGRNFSKYDPMAEGTKYVYALDLLLEVDIFAKEYFPGSLVDEVINIIKGKTYNDTDFSNKRIRCFEYIILSHLSKTIFDFCLLNRNTRKQPRHKSNTMGIINACNLSDIIQFDFSINPLEELTMLTRTSLTGPDGFTKDNVPPYLRDVSDSMKGRICTTDTSDRENCGVLQNIAINATLDYKMKFTDMNENKNPISIPISMVPFLEHDDPTRLQMSASQSRQAVLLDEFDVPMIMSGCEGLYTKYTQFCRCAKKNGKIVHVDENVHHIIIVKYDDGEIEIINIEKRPIITENMDEMIVCVKENDRVKKDDILAESRFCKNGDMTLGRNLLTAVTSYYGRNYEDAIVISDRCSKLFTSTHYVDLSFFLPENCVLLTLEKGVYKPLPYKGDILDANSKYAIVKKIPPLHGKIDNDVIFEDVIDYTIENKDVKIIKCEIYPNSWSEEITEFDNWIRGYFSEQQREETELQGIIKKYLPKKEAEQYIKDNSLDKFSEAKNYRIKSEFVSGVYIKIIGEYHRPLNVGDKLSNRHGNKGVISTIVDNDKMLRLDDGRVVDICINPMGIISRMNIGQLFELHLAMSLFDLKKTIYTMIDDENINEKFNDEARRKYILDYVDIIDKTDTKWIKAQLMEQLPSKIDKKFVDELVIVQPPFSSISVDDSKAALNYTGTKFRYNLFGPLKKIYIANDVSVGYIYFNKLTHMSESKVSQRGIGSYARKTMQPLGGRKNTGGQRAGEMEIACIIAHDALHNLSEFLTLKSDCIELKNEYIRNCYSSLSSKQKEDSLEAVDIKPESVKIMESYLTVIGLDL
jgi:DNA-directed RNA polymerase beta subunit